MEYQFKKFKGKNARQENRITITKSNSIGFPTKFYKNNGIKEFGHVVLYYDETQKAIGIHFTNNETEKDKFTLIHSKAGYGGSVIARSFFKAHNIDCKIYHGRYEWEKYNLDGVGDIFVIKPKEISKE